MARELSDHITLLPGERWVPTIWSPEHLVSDHGRIFSWKKKRLLKLHKHNLGYLCSFIARKSRKVHRIVAEHFIPNPSNLPDVHHDDHNKKNNHVSNLKWVTRQENIIYSHLSGLRKDVSGKNSFHFGRKRSAEVKRKLSLLKQGENHPKFKGYFIVEGVSHTSALAAARANGVSNPTVMRRCRNPKFINWAFFPKERA